MKTEEITKRTYVSPVIEMIEMEDVCSEITGSAPHQPGKGPDWGGDGAKSINELTYTLYPSFSDDEYNNNSEDLDEILSRLQ